jgi:hypothetical protein
MTPLTQHHNVPQPIAAPTATMRQTSLLAG